MYFLLQEIQWVLCGCCSQHGAYVYSWCLLSMGIYYQVALPRVSLTIAGSTGGVNMQSHALPAACASQRGTVW